MMNRLALTSFAILLFFTGCNLFNGDDDQCEFDNLEERCKDASFFRIDQEPAWSPDGETIAFYRGSTNSEEAGIYLISPDGENLRQFHAGGGNAPSWSPDGQWIAFHQGAQIYKKHVESDSLFQLTLAGRNFYPDWSADGEWITYGRSIEDDTGPAGVWLMKPDGSEKEYIFGGAFPVWHPRESSILAVIGVSSTSIWKQFIKNYPLSDQPVETLDAVVGGDNRYPKYSSGGQLIVFTSQSEEGGFPQVWVMNANDTNTNRLTENGGWAADWSPDGDWIVYTETFETGRLWLMRPDGSEKQQLTFE